MNQEETKAMLDAMEQDQNKGSGTFWIPQDGENQIRFLPPLKPLNEVLPYFHHKVHWIDGAPYECLDQSFVDKNGVMHNTETCPACKMSKKLYKISEKDSEERDLAYNLLAKDRYIFRIIDRSSEDQTRPVFYEVGPTIFKKFYSIVKSGKYGNIVHPLEGRDFVIVKQGTGRRTNYDSSLPDADKSPIFNNKEKIKEALSNAVNMKYNELIQFPSYEELDTAVKLYLDPENASSDESNTEFPVSRNHTNSSIKKNEVSKNDDFDLDDEPVVSKKSQAKNSDDADSDQIDSLLSEFI